MQTKRVCTAACGFTRGSEVDDEHAEFLRGICRAHDRHGYKQCMPHNVDPTITELPSLDFSPGYVQRSIAKMPKQGSKRPWRLYQNYALDIVTLRCGTVNDGVMQYS
jgi:monooxygenase